MTSVPWIIWMLFWENDFLNSSVNCLEISQPVIVVLIEIMFNKESVESTALNSTLYDGRRCWIRKNKRSVKVIFFLNWPGFNNLAIDQNETRSIPVYWSFTMFSIVLPKIFFLISCWFRAIKCLKFYRTKS